ncbi:MAG: hypothetical protein Q7R96_01485 [Nanoarchaeota archaeon]|nr:hypothetical protein [Nanoarchaeota archaeon]
MGLIKRIDALEKLLEGRVVHQLDIPPPPPMEDAVLSPAEQYVAIVKDMDVLEMEKNALAFNIIKKGEILDPDNAHVLYWLAKILTLDIIMSCNLHTGVLGEIRSDLSKEEDELEKCSAFELKKKWGLKQAIKGRAGPIAYRKARFQEGFVHFDKWVVPRILRGLEHTDDPSLRESFFLLDVYRRCLNPNNKDVPGELYSGKINDELLSKWVDLSQVNLSRLYLAVAKSTLLRANWLKPPSDWYSDHSGVMPFFNENFLYPDILGYAKRALLVNGTSKEASDLVSFLEKREVIKSNTLISCGAVHPYLFPSFL